MKCPPLGRVPLLVKIAPDLAEEEVDAVAELALDIGARWDHRDQHDHPTRRASEATTAEVERCGAGGLSGPPVSRAFTRSPEAFA